MRQKSNSASTQNPARVIGLCIAVFSSLVGLILGVITWFFRDGMGPDSIESSGYEALRRFTLDFWPVAVFFVVLFTLAFVMIRRPNIPRHDLE
jgi:ABC-type lipoprotein release transport system permease subunit